MTGDGAVPVNVGGSNTLIWAFSEGGSQTLGFHGENDGVTTADFSCDGSSSSAPPSTSPPSSPAPPSTSPPSSPAPPSTSPPSTSPPSSSSCAASSLAGYTYSAPLDSSLSLHWYTVSATKVNLALEAAAGSMAAAGWFSLAWSADGRMAPADAVIGNLPGGDVAAYYMGGYGLGDVQPTSGFSIGSGAALSTSASGSKVMKAMVMVVGMEGLVGGGVVGIMQLVGGVAVTGVVGGIGRAGGSVLTCTDLPAVMPIASPPSFSPPVMTLTAHQASLPLGTSVAVAAVVGGAAAASACLWFYSSRYVGEMALIKAPAAAAAAAAAGNGDGNGQQWRVCLSTLDFWGNRDVSGQWWWGGVQQQRLHGGDFLTPYCPPMLDLLSHACIALPCLHRPPMLASPSHACICFSTLSLAHHLSSPPHAPRSPLATCPNYGCQPLPSNRGRPIRPLRLIMAVHQNLILPLSALVPPLKGLSQQHLKAIAHHSFVPLDVPSHRQFLLSIRHRQPHPQPQKSTLPAPNPHLPLLPASQCPLIGMPCHRQFLLSIRHGRIPNLPLLLALLKEEDWERELHH
ncbi:unnamed protein product [Closterium sp. NIES-65]|nr:unnamed protein product [Closterium sp. NIES-65]